MNCNGKTIGVWGGLLFAVMLSACQSYNAGATLEPWRGTQAPGMFLAADNEYSEMSLAYFPQLRPDSDGLYGGQSMGMDLLVKYPFHFLGNHLSVFPIAGADARYFDITQGEFDENIPFGFGIKFGGGFDINFTKSFYLRGKILYTPERLALLDSPAGVRYSMGLGYRTSDDPVRRGFKTFKTLRTENALKTAKENFTNKNYGGAIDNYRRAIGLGATLGSTDVANLSTALYERAKQNRDNGNYRQALDDFNESMRHQYFMTRQKYSDWKELLAMYEEAYGQNAPHAGYGKMIFPANDNLVINYERGANRQTNPNEIAGRGWNLNLPAGRRVFSLTYDEPHHNRGFLKSNSVDVALEVEEGHIYRTEAAVSGSQVAITITDVTNSELGKNLDIASGPVFSRTLVLREERPRQESVTITIVNNTGYNVLYLYISPADSSSWGSDVLGSSEILRNNASRRVTLPPLDVTRRYDIKLVDRDGDSYTRWNVAITNNMNITFTISDIDLERFLERIERQR